MKQIISRKFVLKQKAEYGALMKEPISALKSGSFCFLGHRLATKLQKSKVQTIDRIVQNQLTFKSQFDWQPMMLSIQV